MTELLGLPYSPWSEKARWALDVRRVPYESRLYQPLLGEPALRWKLGRFTGRVSVPVLTTDDGKVIADSADIARWADGRGEGPTLFPKAHEGAVARFIERSEVALSAGRALALERMLLDDEAVAEMVPRKLRGMLGSVATTIGASGVRRTLRKYDGHATDAATHRATFASVLDEVRAALAANGARSPRTLLGTFTFADIAVAQAMAFIEPPSVGLKLSRGSRRCFPDAELRSRYADLVTWRDELYSAYRALPSSKA
jgi:glutathione S-transferase